MKNDLFIGVDFGTQGARVGIIDMFGSIIAVKESSYPISYPHVGWATQDSNNWWDSFKEAMDFCIGKLTEEQKNNLKAISVCATASTILPVDGEGKALGDAIMWMDIRAKEQADRINATKHHVLEYCGDEVSAEWFIPKLLWIKENEPQVYNKAYKIVEELDYINHRLTGKWVASKCTSVCKWNYIDGEGFNDEYMTEIGLEDYKDKIITNVIPVGQVIGNLTSEIAEELGVNKLPVIQGGIDAHIGMIGMGVVTPGKMATIMGTSFVQLLFTESSSPMRGIWGPYTGAMVEGLTLLEAGQISAGSIVKWYQKIFNITGDDAYSILKEEGSDVPIGSEGVRALDFFQGNRTPYKDSYATGAFSGLTLNHERGHIYRAILESVAFGTKNIIDNFEENDVNVDEIIACGGVTNDLLWMQIISDVTGKEIIVNENTNYGTLLGGAILGATALSSYDTLVESAENMTHKKEIIKPDLKRSKLYEKAYKDYIAFYKGLKDVGL